MRKGSCSRTLSSWHQSLSSHAFRHPSLQFVTGKCIQLIVVLTGIYTIKEPVDSFSPMAFLFQLAPHCGAVGGKHGKQKLQRAPRAVSFRQKGTELTPSALHCLETVVEIQQIVPERGVKSCAVWFKLVVSVLPCCWAWVRANTVLLPEFPHLATPLARTRVFEQSSNFGLNEILRPKYTAWDHPLSTRVQCLLSVPAKPNLNNNGREINWCIISAS